MVPPDEIAACVLEPHFDAVRDTFAEYSPEPGQKLKKLIKTRLVVDSAVHDSPRHYAQCRDDGLLIKIAPKAAALDHEQLVAILAHEFGHAADFAYPGRWIPPSSRGRANWIPDDAIETKEGRLWQNKLWHNRGYDAIELCADAIAYRVIGRPIKYCGDCMLQCFSGSHTRPEGLR